MKIVVCVKQVPDSAAKVVVENGKVSWGDAPLVINPWDEFAMEAALRQKEALGGTVTAITIGSESAKDALKHALAMGADEGVLLTDTAFDDGDSYTTALAITTAIKKLGDFDVIFCGRQAVDWDMGVTGSAMAEMLGLPTATLAKTPSRMASRNASDRTVRPRARSPTNTTVLPSMPPRCSKLR